MSASRRSARLAGIEPSEVRSAKRTRINNEQGQETSRSNNESERECVVCAESRDSDWFPKTRITNDCAHENEVCRLCLQHMVENDMQIKATNEIQCPSCPGILSYEAVKEFADGKVFEAYETKMMNEWKRSQRNWSDCPQPGCGFGGLHEGGKAQPIVTCGACGHKACFTCKTAWHEGLTCKKNQANQRQLRKRERAKERASLATIRKISKACPTCGTKIEKSDGCDHMTCKCGAEWCWICRRPYSAIREGGNTGHTQTCPYHTRNLAGA